MKRLSKENHVVKVWKTLVYLQKQINTSVQYIPLQFVARVQH